MSSVAEVLTAAATDNDRQSRLQWRSSLVSLSSIVQSEDETSGMTEEQPAPCQKEEQTLTGHKKPSGRHSLSFVPQPGRDALYYSTGGIKAQVNGKWRR